MNWKKIFAFIMSALIALGSVCTAAAAENEGEDAYIVILKDGAEPAEGLSPIPYAENYYTADDLDFVADSRDVEGVFENSRLELESIDFNDPYLDKQWYLDPIGIEDAWKNGYTGKGVKVAVIDSGVNLQHEDLVGANITGRNFLGEEGHQDTSDFVDDMGHGTLICGILAARQNNGLGVVGLTPDVSILALRCFSKEKNDDNMGSGTVDAVISAIGYAIEQDVDVINMSIGGMGRSMAALEPVLKEATDKGIILVAPAGNKGRKTLYYPAAFECVTGVAWTDKTGGISRYSQHNMSVYVSAPGTDIYGPDFKDVNGYRKDSGGSFAVPIVVAMAAMAKQKNPDIDTEGFRTLLRGSVTDKGEEGWDEYYGYGVVNIPEFVKLLEETGGIAANPDNPTNPDNTDIEVPDTGSVFTDVTPDAWYADAVKWAYTNSVMSGVGDNKFAPDEGLSRGMIVTILWRMEKEPVVNYAMTFKDVKSDWWYTEAVRWAASQNIVGGYDAESFGPDDPVTREQMFAIIWRYAGYKGFDFTHSYDVNLLDYNDLASASEWALPAIKWAISEGLMSGVENADINPGRGASRAQAASVIMRYCLNASSANN
ncbi:MAG: S8 family serine peptidase [Firmicutes bacterium]|nr:S8 family serine peptidase [Bacillota bacterium]